MRIRNAREKAISIMNVIVHMLEPKYDTDRIEDAVEMAIKALEQEPILDKIRAEMMDLEEELFHRPNTDYTDYAAVRHCVEIIDKCKTESEE